MKTSPLPSGSNAHQCGVKSSRSGERLSQQNHSGSGAPQRAVKTSRSGERLSHYNPIGGNAPQRVLKTKRPGERLSQDFRSGERLTHYNPIGSSAPQRAVNTSRSGERHSQSKPSPFYTHIPHFNAPNIIQHITYRLADALPPGYIAYIKAELESADKNQTWLSAALHRKLEAALDQGYGSCILHVPEAAECVVETWQHFDDLRYRLLEWVVMPNHCHVLIQPFDEFSLSKIVLSWKSYTARKINLIKNRLHPNEPASALWQRNYWDRFIRNSAHYEAVKNYIHMNPVLAGLAPSPQKWSWSSACLQK